MLSMVALTVTAQRPAETIEDDSLSLNEVVVVGFSQSKKVNLTGAVQQVNMKEVLGDRPITSVGAALQGFIPGLTVSGGSSPGQPKSFNIRGTLSLNGGSPLILIDNAEGDINALNPDDIESVTVQGCGLFGHLRSTCRRGCHPHHYQAPQGQAGFPAGLQLQLGFRASCLASGICFAQPVSRCL